MGNGVVSFGKEEPKSGKTVRLPVDVWARLAEALEFEGNLRGVAKIPGKFSLNDLMTQFTNWALDQYWKENGPKPDKMNDRTAILRALDARIKAAAAAAAAEGKKK